MFRDTCLVLLLPVCLSIAGCDKPRLTATADDQRPTATADDLRAARHAMPITEVSLMVRSHYNQNKIIAEIEHRHVPAAIDTKTEETLVRAGAKSPLIEALKDPANILTRSQGYAYEELTSKHDSRAQNERIVTTEIVKPRPVSTDAAQLESPEDKYWKAEAVYRAKRAELEGKVASQQGYINRMRGWGYYQSDLVSAESRLHQYEDDLKNLPIPIR